MKLAVIGGRNFKDWSKLANTVKGELLVENTIISGGAKGADELAYRFAREFGVDFVCYPPRSEDIDFLGFSEAAKLRNKRIVDACDKVIAFPTRESKGTWHAVSYAKAQGKPVRIVE